MIKFCVNKRADVAFLATARSMHGSLYTDQSLRHALICTSNRFSLALRIDFLFSAANRVLPIRTHARTATVNVISATHATYPHQLLAANLFKISTVSWIKELKAYQQRFLQTLAETKLRCRRKTAFSAILRSSDTLISEIDKADGYQIT